MRAISVRQPWAALIVLGIKDVENRGWRTRYRGPVLIHASAGRSQLSLSDIARDYGVAVGDELAQLSALMGGIIGEADIVDCVNASASQWFDGPTNGKGRANYGFVLRAARVVPFRHFAGRLGMFDVRPSTQGPARSS